MTSDDSPGRGLHRNHDRTLVTITDQGVHPNELRPANTSLAPEPIFEHSVEAWVAYWSRGCGVSRDEVGEGDDVVLVVAGLPVEHPTACDQPEAGVVEIAVHHIGGELVLRVLLDLRHPEQRGAAVLACDGDLRIGGELAQAREDAWLSAPVDVAGENRRAQLTRGRRPGVPACREAGRRH